MVFNLINSVIANLTMELTIERALKVSSLLLLTIFKLFSEFSVMNIKIIGQMIDNIIKISSF